MVTLRKLLRAATLCAFICLPKALFGVDTLPGIFDSHFKTLTTRLDGNFQAPPVITLGTDDQISVSFDELAEERSYLRYRLIHCTADWQPSGLVDAEYLDGFNYADINDWAYSRLTATHYVHYQLNVPNESMQPTISGNYLLQVFRDDDPDTTLLQTRFMITEATATASVDVRSVTDIDYNRSHQQVSVIVDATNAKVDDLFNDLRVYVSQNGRVDNEVMVSHPLRIAGRRAYFEHLNPLIFNAGNEYRRMEIVSVTYPGMGVEALEYHDPYYHATLATDLPRSSTQYLYDQTQHGRFLIREYNSSDSDIEADYVVTHFSLDADPLPGQMIFIDGDLTYRRFDPESLMSYNQATGRYERTMLLKQGAYNYQYLVVDPGQRAASTAQIEGDFYPTINEYLVKVYHRRRGERYDRLIATTMVLFNH
jgi:hypothetical protein